VTDFDVTVPTPQVVEVTVGGRGPAGPVAEVYYGQVSRITSGTVTISAGQVGQYVTTGLTGNLNGQSNGIALAVSDPNGIRNVSGERLLVRIYASADVEAGNNHVVGLKLALNGVAIDDTECRAHTGIGAANFAKTITSWMVPMEPDDEVSLFVADFTAAGTLTIQRCRMVAVSVAELDA
jgi:hypothetical protein